MDHDGIVVLIKGVLDWNHFTKSETKLMKVI